LRRSFTVAATAAALAWLLWAPPESALAAQAPAAEPEAAEEPAEEMAPEFEEEEIRNRPTAHIARISSSEAPTIDADLSDLAWAKATVITEFKQREPDPGGTPTERTVLRIMYDDKNFYVGVYAYDSEPDRVIVRSMSRDGEVNQGDHIEITLDPGLTLRNAYAFRIGPSGGRWDGLRLNNLQELPEWNAIWEARAKRVPDGWVAEIAIPFSSISYVRGQNWGFDFTRNIRRKTEIVRWSSINPAIPIADVSEAGTLTGIDDVSQGLGLDVVPYIALRAKHDWSVKGDGAGLSGTAGVNAFYKITPGLTGTVTVNPDFSDAPLDVREVNTTRFSLFYPETRQFFLQDAGSFEFGGRSFRRSNFDRQNNNALPFFSRNIGLVNGRPVSLIGGGKLSGEYGGIGIGALSVLSDETPNGRPGQVLSVARMTVPVFGMSRGGIIFTNGDPTGNSRNSLVGGDFQYRNDTLFGGDVVQADFYYERSFSNKVGEDDSYGVAVNYPNEPWGGELSFKTVGEQFTPALGFVNRPGIRLYSGTLSHLWRYRGPGNYFRTINLETRHSVTTNLGGRIDTREHLLEVQFTSARDHSFYFTVRNNYDRLVQPFVLPHNVIVPPGEYEWNNLNTHTQISRSLPLSFHMDAVCCDYYNGTQVRISPDIRFRPSEYFEMNFSYDGQFIRLPGGKVDINVLSMDGLINFTPDMQFAIQAQYDNISQSFGFLGRYRWEFRPGSEILVAVGQSALIPGSDFKFQQTTVSVRIGHTLRF